MRMYTIALFLFIANLSMGMINTVGIFDYTLQVSENKWSNEVSSNFGNVEEDLAKDGADLPDKDNVFGDMWKALKYFKAGVGSATIYSRYLYSDLGFPPFIAYPLYVLTLFIYGVALIQILRNMSFKGAV